MNTKFGNLVSAELLQTMLGDPDLVIVDCRFSLGDVTAGRKAFELSRVPGAVYADLDETLSGPPTTDDGRHPLPSPELMVERFGQLGIDSTKKVVAYDDRKNMMACRLWWMLRYMGHDAVAVLNGGWNAWQQSGGRLETTPPAEPEATCFEGQPNRDGLVVYDQVKEQSMMIDSRAPERYRGEVEPLDPVAGHIPGAENFYYAQLLDDHGKFLPADQLKAKFDTLFATQAPEDTTFYCGSGVSACVNLIAAEEVGFPISKLYVGSWSEWSRKLDASDK